MITDLRKGVGPMAHRTLDELDMLGTATEPNKEIGRAMAEVDVALATHSLSVAMARCTVAAARLIRAAELFQQQIHMQMLVSQRNAPGLEQVAEGAGSEAATPSAVPSPSAANHRPAAQPMFIADIGGGAE